MYFDSRIFQSTPERRRIINDVLLHALRAADPFDAVRKALRIEHRSTPHLVIGTPPNSSAIALDAFDRVLVVGAGKAGAPMAQAIEQQLGEQLFVTGHVVVKSGHGAPTRSVTIAEAAHPVPDAAGVEAGEYILHLLNGADARTLVVAPISGGGSSLLVAPAAGLTLDDLAAMNAVLLGCGAAIDEVNCLRKHCSAIKGGQLARAASPATLVTLVLSDVVGSPLDAIASGPTVADPTTWADAWAIVERYGLQGKLPAPVIERLRTGLRGALDDTPKPGNPIFDVARNHVHIVGDNRTAARAAELRARELGYSTQILTTYLEGEAKEVGKLAAALAKSIVHHGEPLAAPACLILGGETTVVLGDNSGKGGRNGELALAAALAAHDLPGVTIVSLATDGTDGPTDSAGAMVDGGTVERGARAGLSAEDHLRRHDSYPFLLATNDLLRLDEPTRTNVNDLLFVFVGDVEL